MLLRQGNGMKGRNEGVKGEARSGRKEGKRVVRAEVRLG